MLYVNFLFIICLFNMFFNFGIPKFSNIMLYVPRYGLILLMMCTRTTFVYYLCTVNRKCINFYICLHKVIQHSFQWKPSHLQLDRYSYFSSSFCYYFCMLSNQFLSFHPLQNYSLIHAHSEGI